MAPKLERGGEVMGKVFPPFLMCNKRGGERTSFSVFPWKRELEKKATIGEEPIRIKVQLVSTCRALNSFVSVFVNFRVTEISEKP